jgi:hypothetical protein
MPDCLVFAIPASLLLPRTVAGMCDIRGRLTLLMCPATPLCIGISLRDEREEAGLGLDNEHR